MVRRLGCLVSCVWLGLAGCRPVAAPPGAVTLSEPWIAEGVPLQATADGAVGGTLRALRDAPATGAGVVTVDYPRDLTVFPPEIVPPTFLWHDDAPGVDGWVVDVELGPGRRVTVRSAGRPAPPRPIDPAAVGKTNALYEPTPYQASARSWTPTEPVWRALKEGSVDPSARVVITGYRRAAPDKPLSRGEVRFSTSRDPVGAPIFYRDVPLMPSASLDGVVKPLAPDALPLIAWRLRDIARPESRVVLTGMVRCANCHSFSRDGKTLGMDMDGPDGDKGAYAVVPVTPQVVVKRDDIITWNSFPEKPKGSKTIGFLSQVSPDGRHVISTVNEQVFAINFPEYQFLQVFYPTRGILAFHDQQTGQMKALPGADDPAYVHCDPVWTPDGKEVIFARAEARDAYAKGQKRPMRANDPDEPRIQYSLYRIPFNDGKGGTAVPIPGAGDNGMSNTFPKVSPDGKWLVWVKCRNGQLMRPDSRLWILPLAGGSPREMTCNTPLMNSWHTFSPNGRWMAFSSKAESPYTQLYLTHIDDEGRDSPAVLVPNSTAANRAVNIPEFMNGDYDSLVNISVPSNMDRKLVLMAAELSDQDRDQEAVALLLDALKQNPENHEAHRALGDLHRGGGRLPEALKSYAAAARIAPEDAEVRLYLGGVCLVLGDRPCAERELKEAQRLAGSDGNVVARLALGTLLNVARVADLVLLRGLPLTSLDLSEARAAADLAPLRGMPLREIHLSGTPVADLSVLRGMEVGVLSLDGTSLRDLHQVAGLPLRSLNVSRTAVKDLGPLKGLRLEELNVGRTAVRDISVVRGMPLRRLSVEGTPVADLSPVRGMALLELYAGQTGVKEISVVAGMPLQTLGLQYTEVADIRPLEGVPVKSLNLAGTRVADLSPLAGAPLADLHIHETLVTDLAPLQGMALKTLGAFRIAVSDLAPLRGQPLEVLGIAGTRVTDLSPLKGMYLRSLSIDGTRVANLEPLAGMPLEELYLGGVPVTDLSPLQGMKLKKLAMEGSGVEDVTVLAGMPLQELYFSPTTVKRGLPALRAMRSLRLVGATREMAPFPAAVFWKAYDAGELGGTPRR
jgi:Leucine-rich repeat (LRR) protein